MAISLETTCSNYADGKRDTCRAVAENDWIRRREASSAAYMKAVRDNLAKRTACDVKNGCPKNSPACDKCLDDYLRAESEAKRIRDAAESEAERIRNCHFGYPQGASCVGISARGCKCCDERDAAYNACIKTKGIPPVVPVVNPPIPVPPSGEDPLKQAMDEYFKRRQRLFENPISQILE
jgi:hypothetical protein